jgi:hypothetical protein
VTQLDSLLASQSAALAISVGSPAQPSGLSSPAQGLTISGICSTRSACIALIIVTSVWNHSRFATRGRNSSPSPLDVPSAAARAQIIELHLVFDFFLERQHFFPIDLGL